MNVKIVIHVISVGKLSFRMFNISLSKSDFPEIILKTNKRI